MNRGEKIASWLALLVISHGCTDRYESGPYWGRVSANKNGSEWTGEIRGTEQAGLLGLTIDKINSDGFLREHLLIIRIPKQVGRFAIPKADTVRIYDFVTAGYFTIQDDGDVIEGVFNIDPSGNSFVEIESIRGDVLKGSFQVTVLVDPADKLRYPHLPDTVRFTNGDFKTKILMRK